MDKNTVCTECGTENEPIYEYCKNCGAFLPKIQTEPQATPPFTPFSSNTQYGPQYQGGYASPPYSSYTSKEGIPAEDLAIFIGKKADRILPKFMQMDLSGSKIAWCWPVAVLAFLLGPIGAGLWFLYRKMFKAAFLFLTVGIVLDVAVAALNSTVTLDPATLLSDSGDLSHTLSQMYHAVFDGINPVFFFLSYLYVFLSRLLCALTGMFAYYLYQKHCISKILSYRQSGIDMRYYKLGLASVGGTSAGLAVLGIVSVIILKNLLTVFIQYLF